MIFESKTPEYYEWVQSLQYLDNKEDFTSEDNSIISKNLQLIIPHIERDHNHYYVSSYGYYMTITLSNGRSRFIYNTNYGLNIGTIQRVFTDKIITAEFLRYHNMNIPKDYLLLHPSSNLSSDKSCREGAIAFAEEMGYPLFFKPVKWSFGIGVSKIHSSEELSNAIDDVKSTNPYMVQELCHGKNDYRVLYLNGEILAAYQREFPSIQWDGVATIESLIAEHVAYKLNPEKVLQYIMQQWLTPDSILDPGQKIEILPTANIATWWSVKMYENITQEDRDFIQKISDVTGSNYFGADIMTNGSLSEWVILELNSTPWTDGIRSFLPEFWDFFGSKIRAAIKQSEGIID